MFSYAEAETILARLHHAERDQTGAFRGRLQHLKKLGIPLGVRPGRGKKINYEPEHLYQWALCLEYAQLGLDPAYIAQLIHVAWSGIFSNFKEAEAGITSKQDDLFLYFTPRMIHFSTSIREDNVRPPMDRTGIVGRAELDKHAFPRAKNGAEAEHRELGLLRQVMDPAAFPRVAVYKVCYLTGALQQVVLQTVFRHIFHVEHSINVSPHYHRWIGMGSEKCAVALIGGNA